MICDYTHCIYNKESLCILEDIGINSLGMCNACIAITIPGDVLESMKEKQLTGLEVRWRKWQTKK